jgi:hypothetical protein
MGTLRRTHAALSFLVLAVLACGLPFDSAPDPTAAPAQQTLASPTPTDAELSTPRAQPSPIGQRPGATQMPATDGGGSGCSFDADYVSDVSIPDDTVMEPGASFVKTWRVRNSGTCNWDSEMALVFHSGDRMSGPDAAPVGAVAVGANADLDVELEAPTEPGTFRGNWQLETGAGRRFGPVLYVRIVVPEP